MEQTELPWAARSVDAYCERVGPEFWAEPVNALSNLAFPIAALIMLLPVLRARNDAAMLLVFFLAIIGGGSFLFHTFAQSWAGPADTIPIALFVIFYVYIASRHYLETTPAVALLAVLGVFALTALIAWLVGLTGLDLNGSQMYLGTLLYFFIFAAFVARHAPATARGILIGGLILSVSVFFRSIDEAVCSVFPLGTHFLWHILNATTLGWMIHVLLRHGAALAPPMARG